MCEKAEEIQKNIKDKLKIGDNEFIILFRQDQLQEMFGYNKRSLRLIEMFSDFAFDNIKHFKSYEQLWLAFVMKEKYNKVWNGYDWCNI